MTNPDYELIADMCMYPSSEAGRLVGIHPTRIRRWLKGYSYTYESDFRHKSPVLRRSDEKATSSYASFLDLIDLLFVKRFLDYGVSLQKLRRALNEATEILGTNHFAREIFFTDGKAIFVKVGKQGDNLLQLLSGGQWVIASVIKQLAKQIEFDRSTGLARRWIPNSGGGLIVIDPLISFGRPTLVGKGIVTENIYDFYIAENKDIIRACKWWKLSPREVRAAVSFEGAIAA
jgi:uncharacterized protein (DUF433 family)/DNA-binding transcriptional MerR regulator